LYGAFVWACRALNRPNRRCPARAGGRGSAACRGGLQREPAATADVRGGRRRGGRRGCVPAEWALTARDAMTCVCDTAKGVISSSIRGFSFCVHYRIRYRHSIYTIIMQCALQKHQRYPIVNNILFPTALRSAPGSEARARHCKHVMWLCVPATKISCFLHAGY
jgi:hypothetical protein